MTSRYSPHSVGSSTSPTALGLLLRHSARSRGIQVLRAQSVLQAFLDAATARSMTWWFAQHGRGYAGIAGGVRSMTGGCAARTFHNLHCAKKRCVDL